MKQDDLSFISRERRLEIDKILRESEKKLEGKSFEQIIAESMSFEEFRKRIEIDKILREREKLFEDFIIENGVLVKYLGSSDNVIIPDGVTCIEMFAFCKCTGLVSVTIPKSVTKIGVRAFAYCTALTEITIPDSVTDIGPSAFFGCTGLKSVTIPNSVNRICNCAFHSAGLTSITIPDSVKSIGNYAFSHCHELTSITIPDSVTSIGECAFNCCDNIVISSPKNSYAIGYAKKNHLKFTETGGMRMTYVISDIHGEYEQFISLLEKINFSEKDTLYVLGDVIDRGAEPVKVLRYMMNKPNIVPIMGNHEIMACEGLKLLLGKINRDIVKQLNSQELEMMSAWIKIGANSTIGEFTKLGSDERTEILDYISGFAPYKKVSAGGNEYLLIHAAIDGFEPNKPLDEYSADNLVWGRTNYAIPYFDDIFTVSGHTPTQSILDNPRPGYIFRANNHIAIDCGAYMRGGRLAAICLDTGEEFYSR